MFALLVKVLFLVDGDKKPSTGFFLYGELLRVRDEIKVALKNQELHYHLIIDIIDDEVIISLRVHYIWPPIS